MRNLCILGATGSIGDSTIDVVRRHPDKYKIVSLSAYASSDKMLLLCKEFQPSNVVMVQETAAQHLRELLQRNNLLSINVISGEKGLITIAESDECDTVMAAIVGFSGLLPTLAAVEKGKRVLLANKEALVTSGQIFIDAVNRSGAQLLPIDSEHNAIFQCLPSAAQSTVGSCQLNSQGISKLLLTGSGGPFRTRELDTLPLVTPAQACAHPNWDMGKKISVDSATMMNKGLEFIEAKWLFNVEADDIQVVLHPQSTIHSMVQYKDGSVIAQMGNPDMRTPIAHALAYPERIDAGVEPLDFFNIKSFEFQEADFERYPNLKLAINACKAGQGACTALNAANEVAVELFLNEKIRFTEIADINEAALNKFIVEEVSTIEEVVCLDNKVRSFVEDFVLQTYINQEGS